MVLSEAASFLRIAAADLDTARASTDPTIFREGAWGFWLQQAVEKALKVWLLNFGVVPPTTHDLSLLTYVETQLLGDEPADQIVPCEPPSGLG
jgi:HEPN domain-containing protein